MKVLIIATIFTVFCFYGKFSYVIPFIFAVVVHELGHIAAAGALGVKIIAFRGSALGLRIKYSKADISTLKECMICAAGSAAGIMTATVVAVTPLKEHNAFLHFAVLSASLGIMNLLPIRGLDGGAIAESILECFILPDRAESVMRILSLSAAIILWLISVRIQLRMGGNISLLVLAVYFLLTNLIDRQL